MSGFDTDTFNALVSPLVLCGALVESRDWSAPLAPLAPENFTEGRELVLDEGESIIVDLGVGLHHGHGGCVGPLPPGLSSESQPGLKRPALAFESQGTGRVRERLRQSIGYRYRCRQLTIEGPACASELLFLIGDAVRFECYRNLLLADLLLDSDSETEEDFARYHANRLMRKREFVLLDAAPLADPTEGLSTEEVAALLGGDLTCGGGATCFEGLEEESPGFVVCRWSKPFA
jgi:hypothetical protein